MQIAPLPLNEVDRIKTLYNYRVLDMEPGDILDDLTRLASSICETPIALITLIDTARQWFKSKVGIQISEAPRDICFCAYTILESDVFMIPDALLDDRFADNPFVIGDPHIRFYAGAPSLPAKDMHWGPFV